MIDTIIAGDALAFDTAVVDSAGNQYMPSDGWTMALRLIPRSSGTPIDIPASAAANGIDFSVDVTSATTAAWTVATYSAVAMVTLSGERKTVYLGEVRIKADPALASTYDERTSARVALEAAQALYYDFAANRVHVLEYEVAGRRMRFASPDMLIKHIELLKRDVREEEVAARLASGLGSGRKVQVRFTT